MNGSPKKKAIALAQTYFAVKTRQQELIEQYDEMTEDEKRLAVRHEMTEHNKRLADAAHDAGVLTNKDFGTFQNYGYKGLYGGLDAKQIHARKGLKKSQHILDHMGTTELAANLFRATQTEEKLRRDNIKGKDNGEQAGQFRDRTYRQHWKIASLSHPAGAPYTGHEIHNRFINRNYGIDSTSYHRSDTDSCQNG